MGRLALLSPLQHRDYRLLWFGSVASLLGDGVYTVALAWLVYDISDSATALSVVGLMVSVGLIGFLLPAGVVADRVDRRRQMIAADLLRGVVVATMAALALTGSAEIWMLAALGLFYGIGDAFFNPASTALMPQLLPGGALIQANALAEVTRPLAFRFIGPAVGGGLVAVLGAGSALLVDAGTFLVSIACVAAIAARAKPTRSDSHPLRELREGWAFVRAHVWLWGTLLVAIVGVLSCYAPMQVVLPLIVRHDLHAPASAYGLILTVGGLGGILGGLVMSRRGMPRRAVTVMLWVWAISSLAQICIAPAGTVWQLAIASLVFSAGMSSGAVIWGTLLQTRVPGQLLGRVSSVDWMVSFALAPLSFALTGPIADAAGTDATMIGSGALGFLSTIGLLYLLPGFASDRYEPGDVVGEAGVADVGGVHADDLDALARR